MKPVLSNDLIRAVMVNIEFDDVTSEDLKDILYQYKQCIPQQISIYRYSDIDTNEEFDPGFDGTIIHFYDSQHAINEMYTIFRGTELKEESDWRPKDWVYNLLGIFVGYGASQYTASKQFDVDITDQILSKYTHPLTKIGLGFSLGGNLIQTLQMIERRFSMVYTFNDARPSFYQLATIDSDYRTQIEEKLGTPLEPFSSIYEIPVTLLEELAGRYDSTTIHKLNLNGDLLRAAHRIPGFLHRGHQKVIMNIEVNRLANVVEGLPKPLWNALRHEFSVYGPVYNDKGFDSLWEEITGIDPMAIEAFFRAIVTYQEEGFQFDVIRLFVLGLRKSFASLDEIVESLPLWFRLFTHFYKVLPEFITILIDQEFIDPVRGQQLMEDLKELTEFFRNGKTQDLLSLFQVLKSGDGVHVWRKMVRVHEALVLLISNVLKEVQSGVNDHALDTLIAHLEKRNCKIIL